MAIVYLPLGYPLLSGSAAQTVIYQGVVARLYTVPKDPRTDSQLFERKYLHDFVKTRSLMGLFLKGACKTVLGAKWATVLYQLGRLDHGDYWSAAWEGWSMIDESERQEWRDRSPYQATYNDPGRVFYAMCRFTYQILFEYSGISWRGQLWAAVDYESASEWFYQDLAAVMVKGTHDNQSGLIVYEGPWGAGSSPGSYNGTLTSLYYMDSGKCWFYCFGRTVTFIYAKYSQAGLVPVWVDGKYSQSVNQWVAQYTYYQQETTINFMSRGLHYVEVRKGSGITTNVDAFRIG